MKEFCSFSEAIREGAKLRPQARIHMFRNGATCALGAAAEAIGFSQRDLFYGCHADLVALYPYLQKRADCPVYTPTCGLRPEPDISSIIVHLNDDHEWTREQVADWLESEEEKLGFVTLVENEASITSEEKALVTA